MVWLQLIRRAFESLGGEASYQGRPGIYSEVERIARNEGFHLTDEWKATVRRVIESHSSDSQNYRSQNADIFRHVDRGRWALREIKGR
jgi:hypothetical protein